MRGVIVNHMVSNYNEWIKVFEEHEPKRREAGVKSSIVCQSADNPNNIFIFMEVEDLERIKRFTESEDLKEAFKRGGVTGKPQVTYLSNVRRYEAKHGAAF